MKATNFNELHKIKVSNLWTYELVLFGNLVKRMTSTSRADGEAYAYADASELMELTATASAIYHSLSAALDKAETDGATL